MKRLGIVGGIAPGSTVDYYRLLVAACRERLQDGSYPSIVINSIDVTRLLDLVGAGRLVELTDWLVLELERLARANAEVGMLASNTPHIVFDEVSRRSPIPLVSIVEAAGDAVAGMGLKSVGLLGTRSTMEGRFYPDVFARRGIAIRPPAPADLTLVHDRYMQELVPGDLRPETRDDVVAVIRRLAQDGAEAVLLAGTELPLLLRSADTGGVPLLDATRIHVDAVVEVLFP